jgi:formylglycine-generating enzyme required for sulfatase activity
MVIRYSIFGIRDYSATIGLSGDDIKAHRRGAEKRGVRGEKHLAAKNAKGVRDFNTNVTNWANSTNKAL